MCGLVFTFTPSRPTTPLELAAMNTRLRHRGPDDEGYLLWTPGQTLQRLAGPDTTPEVRRTATPWQPQTLLDEGVPAVLGMAHRRLAIVDLSPWGHQPMQRDGARWWAVYNGEVYNHLELRAELEAEGQVFHTHSDTEVLLAAVAHWGPERALARCNGMWALVLLDVQTRRVLIARDRFGVKPLYLWQGPGGALLMASEIKALLAHPLVKAVPDLAVCARFARQGPQAWRSETEFAGITRFPAGHYAWFNLDAPAALQPQPFWRRPQAPDPQAGFEPAQARRFAEQYTELLQSAVRLRLRADVRVGTALSGGLDSASIAALVNTQLRAAGVDAQQETFSSVYPSNAEASGADESRFVDAVVQPLAVRSNRVEPQASDVPQAHAAMVWAMDTPPANSLMSSWHTYALVAQRGVVVTLDGQGADEQLAGYERYLSNHLTHAPLAQWPGLLRDFGRLQGFGRAVGKGLAAGLVRRLVGPAALSRISGYLGMGADPSRSVDAALAQDFNTHLHNLLLYADKTGMAWSIESRMPFMDVRLVEFLAGVPASYKLHGGWTKWLAREAMRHQLPEAICWRRDKLGWAIPEGAWFGEGRPLAPWLAQQLAASRWLPEVLHAAGLPAPRPAQSLGQRLRLLNLAVWHQLYFEEPDRPGRALGRGEAVQPKTS